jgi:hypothetical protein
VYFRPPSARIELSVILLLDRSLIIACRKCSELFPVPGAAFSFKTQDNRRDRPFHFRRLKTIRDGELLIARQ